MLIATLLIFSVLCIAFLFFIAATSRLLDDAEPVDYLSSLAVDIANEMPGDVGDAESKVEVLIRSISLAAERGAYKLGDPNDKIFVLSKDVDALREKVKKIQMQIFFAGAFFGVIGAVASIAGLFLAILPQG